MLVDNSWDTHHTGLRLEVCWLTIAGTHHTGLRLEVCWLTIAGTHITLD